MEMTNMNTSTDDILIEEIHQLNVLLSDLAKALITARNSPPELINIVHQKLKGQNVPFTIKEIIQQVDDEIDFVKLHRSDFLEAYGIHGIEDKDLF